MSRRSFKEEVKLLRTLKGEECIRVGVSVANILILDFRMFHPPNERGYREPHICLIAECPWRLETPSKVLVGMGDEDEDIETRVQVCVGRRVTRVTVYRPSFMVRLRFSDDLSLWVFPQDSRHYESDNKELRNEWYVFGRSFPDG